MGERSIVLRALEALKRACKDLQIGNPSSNLNPDPCDSPSMKALLELQTKSDYLFFGDPNLSTLSRLLTRLKSLAASDAGKGKGGIGGILFFLGPMIGRLDQEISEVAGSIESEIQSWIDRESMGRLTAALGSVSDDEEEETWNLLMGLEARLARGFDRNVQAELLKSRVFESIEAGLADPASSKRVKEGCAIAIAAMVKFNRDVFVGSVLMGQSVKLLVSMATPVSIRVLRALVAAIKTPLVDEIDSNGEIPRIVALLEATEVGVAAVELVIDMGYFAKKETLESMLKCGLVERLVCVQTSELGGTLMDDESESEAVRAGGVDREERWRQRPLASCVARFAIHVQVGEGLRWRERSWFKLEIIRRVKESVASEAETATIIAEVLWGSTH